MRLLIACGLAASLALGGCADVTAAGCWREYNGTVGALGFQGTAHAICGKPAEPPAPKPEGPGLEPSGLVVGSTVT